MEEIGQRSYPMLYGPTPPHSRHPLGCLLLGSFMANLATSSSSLSIEHIGPLKSSIYLLIKLEKKDFYNFKSFKNYGMSHIKMPRFIRPKIKPFMTSTLIGILFMFMTRYDYIIFILNSFQENYAQGGIVHIRSLKCFRMDRSWF